MNLKMMSIGILFLFYASVCVALCSCGGYPAVKVGVGDDPTWIPAEATRQVGEKLITNRYPRAEIVEEVGIGPIFKYRFATNDTVLPLTVVVDRKTGKARFEKRNR